MKSFSQHIFHEGGMGGRGVGGGLRGRGAKGYIVRRNPKDKLWYALGSVGDNQWMPVSDGFKDKKKAEKWAKSQAKVDVAAKGEVGGV